MKKNSTKPEPSSDERISRAVELTSTIVDETCFVLRIHEINRMLYYSDTISSQVPLSDAATVFEDLRRSQLEYEIMVLCRLWDNPSDNRHSIPSALANLSETEIESLAHKYGAQYPDEPRHAKNQRARIRKCLRGARSTADKVKESAQWKWISAVRDEIIAHNLDPGSKTSAITTPMWHRDIDWLLARTTTVACGLNIGVCHAGFDFREHRSRYRRNAEHFWHGVTVNVKG